tara:strand:- start:3684 stop:4313 length:630 start_codon:yes stop_codon:yes gene_type:complete
MHKSLRKLCLVFGTGILCCSAVFADVFTVEANVLYYDTENSDSTDEIEYGHEEQLLSLLKNNSEIDTLVLNSFGGLVAAAHDMADLVIDAGLNTHVEFNCASACVTVFLAGKTRTLALGGKIGFHKGWWDAASIEEYYNSEKESEGWATPFDFASWLYEDTQGEIFTEFEYLLERGVSAGFSIKTLKAGSDGMWYPRRSELLEGGILRD